MDDQVFDDVQAILTELLDRGSTAEAQREFAETAVNSAVIVAAALCALGVRGAASLVADGTYNKILTQFGWHRLVLDALAKHLNDRQYVAYSIVMVGLADVRVLGINYWSLEIHLKSYYEPSTVMMLWRVQPHFTFFVTWRAQAALQNSCCKWRFCP